MQNNRANTLECLLAVSLEFGFSPLKKATRSWNVIILCFFMCPFRATEKAIAHDKREKHQIIDANG